MESRPSFARQVAMREVAKLAMLRLHFSRGLRRAEMARSRTPTVANAQELAAWNHSFLPLQSGSSASSAGAALDFSGHGGACKWLYFSEGSTVKAAIEHVRKASTLEQITMEEWESAMQDVVEAAMNDRNGGTQRPLVVEPPVEGGFGFGNQGEANQPAEASAPAPVGLRPQELVAAVAPALSQPVVSAPPSCGTHCWTFQTSSCTQRIQNSKNSQKASASPPNRSCGYSQAHSEAEALDESRMRASDVPVERLQDAEGNPPPEAPGEVREALCILQRQNASMSMSTRSSRLRAWPGRTRSSPWIKLMKTMHGSWDGRWPLPSRSEWIAHERAGVPWPSWKFGSERSADGEERIQVA